MSFHLSKEIIKLKNRVTDIGSRVEVSIAEAFQAFKSHDVELAKSVIKRDMIIDEMEVELEEDCLKVIALNQPVAIDLRFITAILKINNDLERMADHAVNISERSIQLDCSKFVDLMNHVETMADSARDMLKTILNAFLELDPQAAYEVWKKDDILDKLHRELFAWTEKNIKDDIENISSYITFLSIGRYLERIGDLATNIAEDVVYTATGEIHRHQMHLQNF